MSDAKRQERLRERRKKAGMVDIRVDITRDIRDLLKKKAKASGRTMKEEIREAIYNQVQNFS